MRVIVLGAGAVGLTTAIRLLEAGCDVRVVTAAPIEATTSYLTAGIWFPTHVGPPGLVAGWGRRTFEVLAGQARDSVPGVVMRESLALYRQPPGRPDWTASVGPVRDATPDELPPGYRYGLRFAVPQAEMPIYQPWLVQQVTGRGGEIVTQDVNDLAELAGPGVDAVVDCPGLGARELVGDLSVYPVRGQIVRVKNPGLVMSVRDEFHPAGRAVRAPAQQRLHPGRNPGRAPVGHHTRSGHRRSDHHQVHGDRSRAGGCGGHRHHRGPAPGASRGPAGRRPARKPGPPASSTTTGTAARASRSAGAAPKTLPGSCANVRPPGYDHRHAGAQARAQAGTASGPG